MDDEFISFGSAEDEVEDEEEVPEEENDEAESGADYNIEDILKKAAITVKRQLDKLELYLFLLRLLHPSCCRPHDLSI